MTKGRASSLIPGAAAGALLLAWAATLIAWQRNEDRGRNALAERAHLETESPEIEIPRTESQRRQDALASEAWRTLDTSSCQTPTAASSCADVEAFVIAYPDSPHSDEAARLVIHSAPAIRGFRDEDAWSRLDVESCQVPRSSRGCLMVQDYVDRYPTGRHADEAHKILLSTARVIATLEAQEHAKAEAAERIRRARRSKGPRGDAMGG